MLGGGNGEDSEGIYMSNSIWNNYCFLLLWRQHQMLVEGLRQIVSVL
jgi:hypothetical protein